MQKQPSDYSLAIISKSATMTGNMNLTHQAHVEQLHCEKWTLQECFKKNVNSSGHTIQIVFDSIIDYPLEEHKIGWVLKSDLIAIVRLKRRPIILLFCIHLGMMESFRLQF